MKIKSKILSFVLVLCLIIPCALVFTACDKEKDDDKPTFTVKQNILTEANDIIDDLTSIYKSGYVPANQTFTLQQMKDTMATMGNLIPTELQNFKYYVEVGELDEIDDIDSITLGSKFNKDQAFKLSLGNNSHLEAKAFYEDDDKIYVAAPVLVFETVNLDKIKINDIEFDFDMQVEVNVSNFTNVVFQEDAYSTIGQVNESKYNIDFREANKYIKLSYAGVNEDDILLTKKVVIGSSVASVNTVNYGLTDLEGTVLGLYPIGYSDDGITQEHIDKFDGATMYYSAYVLGAGVYSVTLNFNLDLV
jgi:hypothetical protein